MNQNKSEEFEQVTNEVVLEKGFKRWYSYNKYSIPMLLTLVSTLLVTITIDFDGFFILPIKLDSHIKAMTASPSNNVAIYFFGIYMISIVLFFIGFKYRKNRSVLMYSVYTLVNLSQIVLIGLYVYTFISSFSFSTIQRTKGPVILSITVLILAALFTIASNVFATIYIDKNYVKPKDE